MDIYEKWAFKTSAFCCGFHCTMMHNAPEYKTKYCPGWKPLLQYLFGPSGFSVGKPCIAESRILSRSAEPSRTAGLQPWQDPRAILLTCRYAGWKEFLMSLHTSGSRSKSQVPPRLKQCIKTLSNQINQFHPHNFLKRHHYFKINIGSPYLLIVNHSYTILKNICMIRRNM